MGQREESHRLPPGPIPHLLEIVRSLILCRTQLEGSCSKLSAEKAKSYTAVGILRTYNREMAIYVCAILLYNMDYGKGLSLTHNL